MTTPRIAALALALATALTACGRPAAQRSNVAGDSAAQPAAEPMACRLVTLDELRTITGLDLKAGMQTADYQGYSICQWDKAAGGAALTLVVNQNGNFFNYQNVPGAVPLSGLGEDAVWNPQVHQMGVQLPKGTMSVNFLSEPFERKWAEQIAKTALGRL